MASDFDEAPPGAAWEITAASRHLLELAAEVGLDLNAVVLADPMSAADQDETDARLVFPSYFCPEPTQWLAVLAGLHGRGAAFSLALVEYADAQGAELFRTRLFPRMDPDTLALLRSFSPGRAAQAEALSERVAEAFRRLALQVQRG